MLSATALQHGALAKTTEEHCLQLLRRFVALKAQLGKEGISAECTVDWRLARQLLSAAASHPDGAASTDTRSTPDCTACLQALLQHSFFSLVQQHSDCHQGTLSKIAVRLANSGCAACLTQLLSTQRISFESWKLAVCRVLPAESSERPSALKLLLAAAPESMQLELCQCTVQWCFAY
jgi:hypothetical protein